MHGEGISFGEIAVKIEESFWLVYTYYHQEGRKGDWN